MYFENIWQGHIVKNSPFKDERLLKGVSSKVDLLTAADSGKAIQNTIDQINWHFLSIIFLNDLITIHYDSIQTLIVSPRTRSNFSNVSHLQKIMNQEFR